MMLHDEARELMVEAYEKNHDAKGIAKIFHISTSTVTHLASKKRKTGSVSLQLHTRGRKKKLTQENLDAIKKLVEEQSDITIDEIIEQLNLHVSYSTVERALWDMGFRRKKKTLHASERDRHRSTGKARQMEENHAE